MKKQYTKRQIQEAIAYWQKQLDEAEKTGKKTDEAIEAGGPVKAAYIDDLYINVGNNWIELGKRSWGGPSVRFQATNIKLDGNWEDRS